MTFAIFTHVPHIPSIGKWYAYAPYVREMNIWGNHVEKMIIVAPVSKSAPGAIDLAYEHPQIRLLPIPEVSLTSIPQVLRAVLLAPFIFVQLFRGMWMSNHLHLRCPGNIGLLAALVQILFPSTPKTAKYAGNWDPKATQPRSYRFQKWLLSNALFTRNMKVLVYGNWPNQSQNIKAFFTATYPDDKVPPQPKSGLSDPIRFLFVGTLSPGKQPEYALELIDHLKQHGHAVRIEFYGEGVQRTILEAMIQEKNLEDVVTLHGNKDAETVEKAYRDADFLLLPSRSEGWPKVVAEAMYWGCIPVVSPVSCVPWMLGHGERGVLLTEDINKDLLSLTSLFSDQSGMLNMRTLGQDWSRQYTLDKFEEEIKKLLNVSTAAPRVLHLIDSLAPGGAERMAVSLANEWAKSGAEAFLCATRAEGPLREAVDKEVKYRFLNKKNALDLLALERLKHFVYKNDIEVIHAHSSSFFWGYLVKLEQPEVRLIWHDHYGKSEELDQRKFRWLKYCSKYFDGIISVNDKLKHWAINHLRSKKVIYLKNFVSQNHSEAASIQLKGKGTFRIVCLANLRPQKDHLTLLRAMKLLQQRGVEASLHLIGKDNYDDYSTSLKDFVASEQLENTYFYGAQTGVMTLLQEGDLGVLSSKSEGLPVALLEYGLAGLPVVCTSVGQVTEVIGNYGKVVPSEDVNTLCDSIEAYMNQAEDRAADALNFQKHIQLEYGYENCKSSLLNLYKP